MFPDYLILALAGCVFGAATSAGMIALLIKLGVVPRIIARFRLADCVLACENALMLGTVAGCIGSLGKQAWLGDLFPESLLYQRGTSAVAALLLSLLGLGAGIFVGCQAMALAEILDMFPMLFRRLKLQTGISVMVLALALGKMAGALWYFIYSYQSR